MIDDSGSLLFLLGFALGVGACCLIVAVSRPPSQPDRNREADCDDPTTAADWWKRGEMPPEWEE